MRKPEELEITHHAEERMEQRRICERDVADLRRFGVKRAGDKIRLKALPSIDRLRLEVKKRAGDKISLPERAIKRIAHEEAKEGVSTEEIKRRTKHRRGLTFIKRGKHIITAYQDDRYGHKRRGGGWRENKRGWNLAAWRFAGPGQI